MADIGQYDPEERSLLRNPPISSTARMSGNYFLLPMGSTFVFHYGYSVVHFHEEARLTIPDP